MKRFLIIMVSVLSMIYAEQLEDGNPQKKGEVVVGVMLGGHTLEVDNQYYKDFVELDVAEHSILNVAFSQGAKVGYNFIFTPRHSLKLYADYLIAYFGEVRGGSLMQTGTLNLDYQFNLTRLVGFFIGANAGASFLKVPDLGNQAAFVFGGNAGVSLLLSSWLELEFRLKVMNDTFAERLTPRIDTVGMIAGATRQGIEFSDLINVSVGLNFKF